MLLEKELFRTASGWRVMFITSASAGETQPGVYASSFRRYIQIWDDRKTGTGLSINPIQYDNGTIAYDIVPPQGVRRLVRKAYGKVGKFIYPSRA